MKIENCREILLENGSNCACAGALTGLIKSKSTKEHSSKQLNRESF